MTPTLKTRLDDGLEALERSDFQRAEEIAREALGIDPRSDDAHRLLGRALLAKGLTEEGGASLRHALSLSGPTPASLSDLALYHRAANDPAAAADLLGQAFAAAPDDAEIAIRLGAVEAARGRLMRAEELFVQALKDPAHASKAHLNYGILLMNQNRLPEALVQFDRALERQPGLVAALRFAARAAAALNRTDVTLSYLERLRQAAPADAAAARSYGRELLKAGRSADALPIFQEIAERDPDDTDAAEGLADALVHADRLDDALEALALSRADRHPALKMKRGIILLLAGRMDEAEEAIATSLQAMPDSAAGWSNLAAVRLEIGKVEGAMEAARRALALSPDQPEAMANLVQALRLSGRIAEARQTARAFLRTHRAALPVLTEAARAALDVGDLGDADLLLKAAAAFHADAPSLVFAQGLLACGRRDLAAAAELATRLSGFPIKSADLDLLKSRIALVAGNADDALAAARQAVASRRNIQTLLALADALLAARDEDAALPVLDGILAAVPGNRQAKLARSDVRLRRGLIRDGFLDRQVEDGHSAPPPVRLVEKPLWRGEPIADKRILVHVGTNIADVLFHLRFIEPLGRLARSVILDVPEAMLPTLAFLSDRARLIRQSDPLPECDVYVPLEEIPGRIASYLTPQADRFPYLMPFGPEKPSIGAAFDALPGFKVAVVPAPDGKSDRLPDFLIQAIAEPMPGVSFANLLRTGDARQMAQLSRMADLSDETGRLEDLAHCLIRADLIISVDSLAAHMAGALARPLWISLPANRDWRWSMAGRRCAFYPTATQIGIKPGETLAQAADRMRILIAGLAAL